MAIGANTTGDVSGTTLSSGPMSTGPSLDAIAQQHGYADFAAWQAAEPELAQQAYNQQPSGDPSQTTVQKPGPRGWRTIPWKQLAINFGSAVGLAFLDAASGAAMVEGPGGSTITLAPGTFTTAGNTIANAAGQTWTIGDNALLASVTTPAAVGGGGAAALSQLSRSGQPPPLRNSPQDQALRQQPTDQPQYNETVNVKAPQPSPSLTRPGISFPTNQLPLGQLGSPPPALDPSTQIAQDERYRPGSLDMPPAAPPPPPTGTSLTSKIFGLLGLGADYLATRQSQNATAAATQQLVQAGQQAKADLSKVYGGVTPVLSDIVQRQQANLSPYLSLGSGAASLLGYGLGIPNVASAPAGVYQPPMDPFSTYPQLGSATNAVPPGSTLAATFQPGVSSPYVPAAPGQTPSVPFPPPNGAPPTPQPASTLSPQTQTQSSYLMRAPTGELEQVPAAQRAWYESKGAVLA